ncbi:carbamoyltransferase family protein [Streptacidiphilus neutrinimicus]|uniref:carbamoyltransferase family protein n=1 Tax=Streptacidiphilus neutrinimicus TaxID=105420 RepID=UPI00069326F3|nr:carbamoyltransferase C-terminal domain-containing protein [Streptacidiphilus neutrinimicus]
MSSHVLGVNLTRTSTGIGLDDGAAALLRDGVPVAAIAEERLTRRKHSGGVRQAVGYCLVETGIGIDAVDAVAVSICCELTPSPRWAASALRREGVQVRDDQVVVVPSHHLSHAASAFLPSPFREAVTVVADNEGNILGPRLHSDYWRNALERTTVWDCRDDGRLRLEPVGRHGDGPDELSLGSAYGYFTRWLGFPSYHDAGQTMALAAYGTGKWTDAELFTWRDGRLVCRMPQRHRAKTEAVSDWLHEQVGISVPPRTPGAALDVTHHEVAALAQAALENALLRLIGDAVERTGLRSVCLAGGVALNCVANHRIARELDLDGLFVQPAASDVGQALGNALWAHRRLGGGERWTMTSSALGRAYTTAEIDAALAPWSDRVRVTRPDDTVAEAAARIADGQVVGWFDGGSEYGIRALGQRSLLADPRRADTKPRLDAEVKRREAFRPYAPSVTAGAAGDWFDVRPAEAAAAGPATFMLQAVRVLPERRERIPAVVHADGTARVHVVRPEIQPRYHALIERFAAFTGVPVLLNTSFNAAGNPIVETPADAVAEFLKLGLDALVFEDRVVTRAAN